MPYSPRIINPLLPVQGPLQKFIYDVQIQDSACELVSSFTKDTPDAALNHSFVSMRLLTFNRGEGLDGFAFKAKLNNNTSLDTLSLVGILSATGETELASWDRSGNLILRGKISTTSTIEPSEDSDYATLKFVNDAIASHAPDVNKAYVDEKDLATLSSAEDYTNSKTWTVSQITDFSSSISAYGFATQSWVNTTIGDYALETYVNAQDQSILTQSKEYTDANKGTGTVTSITAGSGLTGGTITGSGTIGLAATSVTPGSYTNANITVGEDGRLTAAANGSGGGSGTENLKVVTETPYNAADTETFLAVETSGGSKLINLPAVPVTGKTIKVMDSTGNAASNNIFINGNIFNSNNTESIVSFNYSLGFQPVDVALTYDQKYLYILGNSKLSVFKKNGSENPVLLKSFDFGGTMLTMMPSGRAYIALNGNTVRIINGTQTDDPFVYGDISGIGASSNILQSSIAIPSGMNYAVSTKENKIQYIRDSFSSLGVSVSVPATPAIWGLSTSSDSKYLFCPLEDGRVSILQSADTDFPSLLTTLSVGNFPKYSAVTPNNIYLLVCNYGTNTVSFIKNVNTATPSLLTTLTCGLNPYGIAISPDGVYAIVCNSGANTISVFRNVSTATPSLLTTITVGSTPTFVSYSPDGRMAYVVCQGTNSVVLIMNASTATPSVQKTLSVGTTPRKILSFSGGAYLVNSGSSSLMMISAPPCVVNANFGIKSFVYDGSKWLSF